MDRRIVLDALSSRMWRWCAAAALLVAMIAFWPRSAPIDAPRQEEKSPPTARLVLSTWGQTPAQVGRETAHESNPESPMSFDVDAEGAVWILDQVNGRIVRQKRGAAPFVFPIELRGAQDLIVLPSGDIAVLDRLGDRRVDVFAPSGARITSLPLEGKNLREGGAVTGLFAKGDELYAERAHGPLVHLGNRSGESRDRHELLGRPGPGDLLVSAGISDALLGRVYVVLLDRFTQSVSFGAPLSRIATVFVGNDERIYIAAAIKEEVELVRVLCLDLKGELVGKIDLPESPLADESFRDLTPGPDGGVVYAYRDEIGVSYFLHRCP